MNSPNELQIHLDRLADWLGCLTHPLSWSHILIAESADVTYGATTFAVSRSTLASPDEYAARFDEHLGAGHSWINMNAAGVIEEALLVIIELPGYANTIPKGETSVNLSGPSAHSLANLRIAD